MKHPLLEQLDRIIRAHWWRGLMGILGLLLLLQMYSWTNTILDFNHISNLIAQAEDLSAKPNNEGGNQQQNQPPIQPSKNIFKKEQVQFQLTAILMDYAVINGQNVKIGDKAGKAEVKEIGNDYVVIQEDEKEQTTTLELFKGSGGGGGSRSRPMPPPRSSRPAPSNSKSAPANNAPAVPPPNAAPVQVEMFSMPMGEMGMGMTIDVQNLSPEQIQGMRSGTAIRIERQ